MDECKKMKILVLPPDVNHSEIGFTIETINDKEAIRFGLSAIKNVGQAAISAILEVRQTGDSFKSLKDFCQRVNLRVVNRKTLESLIKAGTMDTFGNRNSMLTALDQIKKEGVSLSRRVAEGQTGLFDDLDSGQLPSEDVQKLETIEEAPKAELLSWEKELLGLYLTEHPIEKILPLISSQISHKIIDLKERIAEDKKTKIGGLVTQIRRTFTKSSGAQMAFIKLEDDTGSIEVVVFPKIYEQFKNLLAVDNPVLIAGEIDLRDETIYLIAREISQPKDIQEATQITISKEAAVVEPLEVMIPNGADRELLQKIYRILKENPGDRKTLLVLSAKNGTTRKIPIPFSAATHPQLHHSLEALGCKVIN